MQGVVRRLVVLCARCGQPDRVLGVIQIAARCARRGSVLGVMLTERPLCGCGTILVWSAHAPRKPNELDRTPNTPMQPTAARARSWLFEGGRRRARGG